MKFICSRTSLWNDKQPCPEAVQERFIGIDRRTCKTFEEYDRTIGSKYNDLWLSRGTDHRIENGCIARNLNAALVWVIDLPDMAALLAFISKYGGCVVVRREDGWVGIDWQIEIYDDYRE